MGKLRWRVRLREREQKDREGGEHEALPPLDVCCICLKRIDKTDAFVHLHSKLVRHAAHADQERSCEPGSPRYRRALPRLRAWGEALKAQDQEAREALNAAALK
jgi:hypothetical protein